MVELTKEAKKRISELIKNSDQPLIGIRIIAEAVSPLKFEYDLAMVKKGDEHPWDNVVEVEGYKVLIDPHSDPILENTSVDFVDTLHDSGFKFDHSQIGNYTSPKGPLAEKIQHLFDKKINPSIASHGGYVTIIDVKEDIVYVEMGGGCQGCGMASVTLKQGIEVMLKEAIPQIKAVYDVTDHASGQNPYYQPSSK